MINPRSFPFAVKTGAEHCTSFFGGRSRKPGDVFDGYFYQPGLWPDQAPWKVRLEFIRRSNFSDEETMTFTNLAVRSGSQQDFDDEWTWDASKTNFSFVAEQMVNGVKLKLLPPLLYSPKTMKY